MNSTDHRTTSRVLDILELLASSETGYTLTEIAKIIGAPKSSIFPMIHTLEDRHYISINSNTLKYRIGVSTFAVGSTYVNSQNFLSHIATEMTKLVEICNETCSLGILDGSNVLYVAKKDSPQSLRLVTYVGKQVSANCTALGKALLCKASFDDVSQLFSKGMPAYTKHTITDLGLFYTQLKQVEMDGFAYENEEFSEQIQCIAVPVMKNGVPVVAVSVSTPSFRNDSKKIEIIKRELINIKLKAELLLRNSDIDLKP
ncbi:MAG: IclR family transcriptional regulator [Lachnospiraceae bacterium]|nr:IclR family transcriptional regulator [Lachnospiraceae bacterium]